MSTGTRRTLAEANDIAQEFCAFFGGDFDRWVIAGSVRRRRPEVGDCEHLVIPRIEPRTVSTGLFSETKPVNLLWEEMDRLVANGTLVKHIYGGTGPRWGNLYRGVEFRGMLNEIYTATETNWGNQLVIRTGSADFSERVVTMLKRGGMYRQQDGYLIHVASGEIVPCPDEQTYLKLAGMAWVEPEKRS